MKAFLNPVSRVLLVGSMVIWEMRFGVFGLPTPPAFFITAAAALFPLIIIALLYSTAAINTAVKIIKWILGVTSAAIAAGILLAFYIASSAEGDIRVGTIAATLLTDVVVIGCFLIFIELVTLAIAEFFPNIPSK